MREALCRGLGRALPMPLIRLPSHRPDDLAAWDALERRDATWAALPSFAARVSEAASALLDFAAAAPCYASVSWGKDSTCLAQLCRTLARCGGPVIPLVHVRIEPIRTPHLDLVRDAFLAAGDHPYSEWVAACPPAADRADEGLEWRATLEAFRRAGRRLGCRRYASGLRASESRLRGRRGTTLRGRTCAPLYRWAAGDVWAYLLRERLPVHPVYAMSFGGRLERDHLRVGAIGGDNSYGRGRHERAYWGAHLDEMGY
jgi:phosphoadenosine phosphosulfate reductase